MAVPVMAVWLAAMAGVRWGAVGVGVGLVAVGEPGAA